MDEDEVEWTFEKSYNPHKRKEHIAILSKPGTSLTDMEIMNLFYLMAWKKGYSREDVRIIDSQLIAMIMRGGIKEERSFTQKRIKNLFTIRLPPLLFLPLHHGSHWSLLYYRRGTGQWFHMDSLYPLHSSYARSVLETLQEEAYLESIPWLGEIK